MIRPFDALALAFEVSRQHINGDFGSLREAKNELTVRIRRIEFLYGFLVYYAHATPRLSRQGGEYMESTRWSREVGQVVAKAWSDPAYKARLLEDSTAVLKEEGIDYGPGVQVKVVENTDTLRYLTLPPAPKESELSEEQLGRVAFGAATKRAGNHIPDS
ncbi:MAG: NHLP leader peptide family RiPP precursor [Acidobacteriota bacterium]